MPETVSTPASPTLKQYAQYVNRLRSALEKLANEATGFLSQADPNRHGATNIQILQKRIDEARTVLLQEAR